MGSHSVTCHLAAVTFPTLPQPKLVLDLSTSWLYPKQVYMRKTFGCVRNNQAVSWTKSQVQCRSTSVGILNKTCNLTSNNTTNMNPTLTCSTWIHTNVFYMNPTLTCSTWIHTNVFYMNPTLTCSNESTLMCSTWIPHWRVLHINTIRSHTPWGGSQVPDSNAVMEPRNFQSKPWIKNSREFSSPVIFSDVSTVAAIWLQLLMFSMATSSGGDDLMQLVAMLVRSTKLLYAGPG